jgi:hypothetical protein
MYESGTRLVTDNGRTIDSWPEQHYANGVFKNDRTGGRFKKGIRIVKCLRDEMIERGRLSSASMPSFLIESLLWNAPDSDFMGTTFFDTVGIVLGRLSANTSADATCADWAEINERKYLFHTTQSWSRAQAWAFLNSAYGYLYE